MKTKAGPGLYRKYNIEKADGRPVDPRAEYFVLRLDGHGASTDIDRAHRNACIAAVRCYAARIEPWLPELAREICEKYVEPASLKGQPIRPDIIAPENR